MKRFLILYILFVAIFEVQIFLAREKVNQENANTREIFCTQKGVIHSSGSNDYSYECKEIYH